MKRDPLLEKLRKLEAHEQGPTLIPAISRRLTRDGLPRRGVWSRPFFPYYAIGAVLLMMRYIALTVGTRFLVE
jgi:hypothetical protein